MSNINRLPLLYHLLRWLCSVHHRLYYRRFEVIGRDNIPGEGPLIFAACHQNALMDALAVLFGARRQIVFLGRGDIFRKKIIAKLLRFIRILPAYRLRDGYSTLGKNQDTFDEASQVLRQNLPIGIFPEGYHLGKRRFKPLRKGIARIAFLAEAEAGFRLGLQIVPVGLDYSDYYNAGSDLLVIFGKPLRVADYKEKYLQNPALGMNSLLDDLSIAMRDLMIDIQSEEHYEEIFEYTTNYATTEIKKQKFRDNLLNKFLIQKQATERLNHAFTEQPLVFRELIDEMSSHFKTRKEMSSLSRISKYIILILFFPLFIAGAIINLIPLYVPSRLTRKIKDPHFISSVRFGAGFLLSILWYPIVTMVIIIFCHNIYLTISLVIALPVSAIFSLYYFRLFNSLSV